MKAARSSLGALSAVALLALSGCVGAQKAAQAPDAETADDAPPAGLKEKPLAEVIPINEPSGVFMLDGKPLCFAGSNNYYLTWKSKPMIDSVLKNAQKMGLTVFRHWGHLDMGSLDGSVPHLKDNGTKEGVYFQYWDTAAEKPAYNDGPNGLERLDYLIEQAGKYNIKLILTLTNSWPDFGGMDQYLLWYGLKTHPEFYTDARVKQAYKDWATHLLTRVNSLTGVPYKDDPTIFAWELANEPRVRNYTATDSKEGWDRDTITNWAWEMSGHLRSVDPHHMIAVGDEGMFSGGKEAFYDGADGVDHEALLALNDIDFGTFHLYPDHWGKGIRWADQWIEDHLVAARKAGKPTVLEEYGVVVKRNPETFEAEKGWDRREKAYHQWNQLMAARGGAGVMYWMQAGYDDYLKRNYTDYDGFTVYSPDDDKTAQLLLEYTQNFQGMARACQLAKSPAPRREVPAGFVTTSRMGAAAHAPRLDPHFVYARNGW